MKNCFDRIYDLTEEILKSFDNKDISKTNALFEKEKEEYSNLNIKELDNIIKNTAVIEELNGTYYYDNYELALYNHKDSSILRRMYIFANRVGANRYDPNDLSNEMFKMDYNKYIIINPCSVMYELSSKINCNTETKFILFLISNGKISNDTKGEIIKKMMFINPYLQEKIFSKNIIINDYVKKEDDLFNNLWDLMKETYIEKLDYFCETGIYNTINIMLSKIDLGNEENILVREMYLRTLFNYLDSEKLEEINYEFNNTDLDIENEFGYNQVKNAFRSINKDTEMINKIKVK